MTASVPKNAKKRAARRRPLRKCPPANEAPPAGGGDAAAGKPREKRPTRPSGAVGGARPRPGGKRRNAHFSKLRMAERRKAASSHRREEQSYLASEFGFPGLDLFRSFVANEAFE